ncbi:MAG TPA: lysylphosphatidylglycerol synthase domain-containing protein [Geminicoccus sp.]|uniref:lysylphosphatidylglycerol synthase domain-containing protein n=1 Tax=Geminicoccus sp. TaxID=2024832 RepID=UPI002E35ADCD|nr:lysylphosphatidylglycerol synthase domain-containing protein [Geminicoccus sp.]HEX2529006.1 lysylphosphatidylglycerol synthase domain-containing protein [Geminicoccus sp.]
MQARVTGAFPERAAQGEAAPPAGAAKTLWKRWGTTGITVASLVLAGYLLHRTFSQYSWEELWAAVLSVPMEHLLLACLFSAASYLSLTWFDWLGIRYAGRRLPYPKVALASFLGLSIGHTLGLAALSSGMIRYRFYRRWGLSNEEVAKIILLCGVTVGVGLIALGGAGLLLRPDLGERITGMSHGSMLAMGAGGILLTIVYVVLSATLRAPLRIYHWSFQMPTLKVALGQVAAGTVNFILVAACLHQTLLPFSDMPFLGVAAIFIIANTTTMISNVPGGLGVIESVVLFLMPGDQIIGGLIAFRCIYFFLPLLIGGLVFAITELRIRAKDRRAAGSDAPPLRMAMAGKASG